MLKSPCQVTCGQSSMHRPSLWWPLEPFHSMPRRHRFFWIVGSTVNICYYLFLDMCRTCRNNLHQSSHELPNTKPAASNRKCSSQITATKIPPLGDSRCPKVVWACQAFVCLKNNKRPNAGLIPKQRKFYHIVGFSCALVWFPMLVPKNPYFWLPCYFETSVYYELLW